ncbi:hypothetical protein PENTCL1PPCAC_17907 [Pristionchus entomophagus]|uniref:Uncharacterized protein n=1 Tax=Pristionchus entomophagus TaxID=358040 RepID=A0AAV5TNH1_9BILA|nr:hypothetical protein PENTCL1PPCAC_17907 [Pristionchus entomophagus]
MRLCHLLFLFLPHVASAILCRICTNCELETMDTFSICDPGQSCYTLNRANSKMTEMGCGNSCSFVERSRTKDDKCHLCQYDKCNSGKKIIVRGDILKKSTVIKTISETTTEESYIEREIETLPVDEIDPFPIDMAFPHRVISSSDMAKMNGSLISHSIDWPPPLPIPVDESEETRIDKNGGKGVLHAGYDDILDEDLEREVEFDLDSKVDNEKAERVKEEEMEDYNREKDEEKELSHLIYESPSHDDLIQTSLTPSHISLTTVIIFMINHLMCYTV